MVLLKYLTVLLLVYKAHCKVFEDCQPNPCLNGGVCREDWWHESDNTYICYCREGYSGDHCQQSGKVRSLFSAKPKQDRSSQEDQCKDKQLDLAFLVDSSRSISGGDLGAAMTFVDDLSQRFTVSASSVRVSVVQFAHRALRLCCFTDDMTNSAVSQCVKDQASMHGSTKTDVALRYERQDVFTARCGARGGATPVLLLLTDGRPDHVEATKERASALKNEGVNIVCITIGAGEKEINTIETMASEGLAFHAKENPLDVLDAVHEALCRL